GRSNTLGVVSFDTTLYGPASTLYGIEQAAHEAGYFITIASLKAFDRASVLDAIERLRILGVDGILVIAPQETAARALLRTPAGRAGGRPDGRGPCRLDRPVRGRRGGDVAPAGAGASQRLARRRARGLAGGAAAGRGLARRAAGRRRSGPRAAGRRLEPALGL